MTTASALAAFAEELGPQGRHVCNLLESLAILAPEQAAAYTTAVRAATAPDDDGEAGRKAHLATLADGVTDHYWAIHSAAHTAGWLLTNPGRYDTECFGADEIVACARDEAFGWDPDVQVPEGNVIAVDAIYAVYALAVRDRIDTEVYDALTRAIRRGVGPIHPDDADPMTAAELRCAREGLGLSTDALAELLDTAGRTVRRWESGTYLVPDGVRDFLARFREEVDAHAAHIAEESAGYLTVVTYRSDAAYAADYPDSEMTARWHRQMIARVVAARPGLRIVYRG
jgi:hypothetical protein